ncbi:MAG: 3-hydroxyacyl-CoA dehydrogenase [Rhodospirillaceae bacterium]|nr:3-hydroxyacyl-CoA dehydrogenase [Rhodospirillaceae bacterium]MYK13427.1 3-hydroxyacyl-CoA dehydrogenase [Rhodospirillaceae bacterium]
MTTDTKTVVETRDRPDGVRVVTLNNPPVNAIGWEMRQQLRDTMRAIDADPAVKGVVLTGAGRAFIAGADIRQFGQPNPPGTPSLTDGVHAIEDCSKTVVAAVNGPAAGGGLEVALGCHYRIAGPKARLGLPEVNIGTIPGATGTQRLPRLAGLRNALDMIVSGDLVPAARALELGIVEAIEDDPVEAAAAMALARPPKKLREDGSKIGDIPDGFFDDYKKGMARRWRGFEARFKAVDAVAKIVLPYDEAVEAERVVFRECQGTPEARAMRHVFFSDRQAARHPSIPKDTPAATIETAAVIGCGTMGGGIAMNFANAGIPVKVLETSAEALEKGLGIVAGNYAATVSRGRLSQEAMDRRMGLISGVTGYDDIADADIVIEAVFENMDIKKEVFGTLDVVCKEGAVLATNTSTLDVDEIANATARPEAVVGTHFFSPANVMRLIEIVRGAKTSDETAQTAMKLSPRIGKVGVMCGVCDGFVGNRMLYQYSRQANFLIEEGALPQDVDRVIYDFGLPMGPFAMGDLAGVDVGYLVRQERLKKFGPTNKRESKIADAIYHLGRYGQKTRKGWYDYAEGSRTPQPNAEVTALIEQASADLGIARRAVSDEEILERCLYPLINEGAKLLAEGIAARPLDIDLIWIYGYGFPRYCGGPMHWADEIGPAHVLERLEHYARTCDPDWLEPAPLLREIAGQGTTFREWAEAR